MSTENFFKAICLAEIADRCCRRFLLICYLRRRSAAIGFFGFFDFWVKCGKSCFPKGYRNLNTQSGRKETVLDLAKFVDKGVQVKLTGGRQVTGTLKGYDQLLNLVLDEAVEFLRDQDDPLKTTDQTRRLGLINYYDMYFGFIIYIPWPVALVTKSKNQPRNVCRGTAVMLVSPTDGTDEIANPFIQPDGA
ncbi:U6 snRNA-associated Sm-like protein LSm7 [Gossypium arboreum]|uniref:U6 snRNA-associated Sm-like protein LSm7 n=1 Tax=Gossypium arboreum TaxID=29729 RepID=A0A0B0ME73_GOSAR|nr:U6 snRNA-associated Sm-like protein LSm7 [Gossypium arboreum]